MGLFSFLDDLPGLIGGGLKSTGSFLGSPGGFGAMAGLGALSDLYSGYLNNQQMNRKQQIANEYNNPAYVNQLVQQAYQPITDQQRQQLIRGQMAAQSQLGMTQGQYPLYLIDQTLNGDAMARQQMAQNRAMQELQGASGAIPNPGDYGFQGGSLAGVMSPYITMQLMQQIQNQNAGNQQLAAVQGQDLPGRPLAGDTSFFDIG